MLYMSIGCYFKRIKSSDVVGASGWSWLVWFGWDGMEIVRTGQDEMFLSFLLSYL